MWTREGDWLGAEAQRSGKGQHVVRIWHRGSGERLVLDTCNLLSKAGRERILSAIPPDLTEEAKDHLFALASDAMNAEHDGSGDLQGRELLLPDPDPWPEAVSGAQLLSDLAAVFRKYVSLPEGADTALALWTVHAHAHDVAEVSPILALTSPVRRCGKSRTMELLRPLVPRSLSTSNLTPAVLFRTVEKYRPTLLVDEVESFLVDREELRGLLNSGHVRSGATVLRTVGEDFEPRMFSTWAPKAVALIGPLPTTLEDRAILIRMRRRAPHEAVARLRLDRLAEFAPLCQRAARWARDNSQALREADPAVPEVLHDRAADNWRPLLAIAGQAGGEWPEQARRAALALSGAMAEGDSANGILLLSDLRDLFAGREADRLPSADIVRTLAAREDSPWAECKAGKPISQVQLANLLKPYGVAPRSMRFEDGTARGYFLGDLEDAFSRYLPPVEVKHPQQATIDAAGTTSATRNSGRSVAPPGNGPEPLQMPLVTGVAGWEPQ